MKDYKTINKLYRKVEDENIKKKLESILDELDESDDATQEKETSQEEEVQEEEKVEEKEEKPQEEKKEETKQEETQVNYVPKDEFDKAKTIIEAQQKQLDELNKKFEKTKQVGAQSQQTYSDEDDEYGFDNIFNNIKSKPQYKK